MTQAPGPPSRGMSGFGAKLERRSSCGSERTSCRSSRRPAVGRRTASVTVFLTHIAALASSGAMSSGTASPARMNRSTVRKPVRARAVGGVPRLGPPLRVQRGPRLGPAQRSLLLPARRNLCGPAAPPASRRTRGAPSCPQTSQMRGWDTAVIDGRGPLRAQVDLSLAPAMIALAGVSTLAPRLWSGFEWIRGGSFPHWWRND